MGYRVMIVDDEPLIQAGIASLLDWEEYDCVITGRAANGDQALVRMAEQKPDIVITDIKMPGMDGIELMRQVRERGWDDIVFILLTNLEEFSLARQAMSLGAVDYLVKMELTPEKLADSLRLAAERREMKRKAESAQVPVQESAEEIMREYFDKLLCDGIGAVEPAAEVSEPYHDLVMVLVSFNYGYLEFSEGFTRADQKRIIVFAENIIGQMAKGYFEHICLLRRSLNSLVLILSADDVSDYAEQIRELGVKIISVIKDYFEVSVSVAVSTKKEGPSDFSALLYEAMSATDYYFSHSQEPVVFYSPKCEENAKHTGGFHIGFLKKDLSQAVTANDSTRLLEIFEQVVLLLAEHNPSRQQAVNACANLYFFLVSFFEEEDSGFPYEVNIMEKLGRLGTMEQIVKWITWFAGAVADILERRRDSGADRIAELVRGYVFEHYRERISLGQVAEALNISQGYLSTAFKKQTGESFTNYVQTIKIEKAKELIESHQYMMYEVSDLLGFDTPFYFSKVFKKVTGISPKEYETSALKMKKL